MPVAASFAVSVARMFSVVDCRSMMIAVCSRFLRNRLAVARSGPDFPAGTNASNFAPLPQRMSDVGTPVRFGIGQTSASASLNWSKSLISRRVALSDAFERISKPVISA